MFVFYFYHDVLSSESYIGIFRAYISVVPMFLPVYVFVTLWGRGGTPYIGYTGMCGLYGWAFFTKKSLQVGIFGEITHII